VWLDSAKPCGLKKEINTLFVYGKYSINWHHLAANVIFHPLISCKPGTGFDNLNQLGIDWMASSDVDRQCKAL
jgi:hypothetical protein